MSDKNEKNKAEQLLDESDYEYEKRIYDQQKQLEAEREEKRRAAMEERKRKQKEAQKEHDRQIARERIELMKAKNSEENSEDGEPSDKQKSEQEDEDTESVEETVPFKKKAENFLYHNKWWLGILAVVLVVGGFIFFNELSRKDADLTIIVISNNGLEFKQQQVEKLFEEYVDDIDGNGYVHVSAIMIPLESGTVKTTEQQEYRSKFLSLLHSTEDMIVITDSKTDPYYTEILDHDLKSKFPGNKYISENGFSLNMKLVADRLEYEDMPNDIYINIRQPVATVEDSAETAQKNYDLNFKYLKKMIEDLTKKAEETNDPGLPDRADDSSSQTD